MAADAGPAHASAGRGMPCYGHCLHSCDGGDACISQWDPGWGVLARATVSFLRLMPYPSGMRDAVRLSECGG